MTGGSRKKAVLFCDISKTRVYYKVLMWLDRTKRFIKTIPDKKSYLEVITAALTIPVLLTVLLNNLSSLNHAKPQEPSPTVSGAVVRSPTPTQTLPSPVPDPEPTESEDIIPSSTPVPSTCTPRVGTVTIEFPHENQSVQSDPVCLDIVRIAPDLCPVVWSYKINDSSWSDYTDRSICLYGLSGGEKRLELRVRSIASSDEIRLQRIFTIPTPPATPTTVPVSTTSAALDPAGI